MNREYFDISTPRTPFSISPRDMVAGVVVFLVALPLCLGVALASDAPLISGVVAGIVGGILVGLLSGSHSSVSGPAAGLTAVVAAQIHSLGSFETFLLAVVLAGIIQIVLGFARAGFLSAFIPSSVIKGLLAAIGIILIIKQIPHIFGHDGDPEGDFAYVQVDQQSPFSELALMINNIHLGAATIGLLSIALLFTWDRVKLLKKSPVPSPLIVVMLGVVLARVFQELGAPWAIGQGHFVQVPVAESFGGFMEFLSRPNFAEIFNPAVHVAAITIAAVASLETLLNLEAVDKIDPRQRCSPPSRELLAQGVGNTVAGLLGGLPITSVIVRSSVNVNAGGRTKLATITHGALLLFCVVMLPEWLNIIPLSCLAAILFVTGVKLASPSLARQMWAGGRSVFIPFVVTVLAIVLTDLLIGVLIGLAVSIGFILGNNVKRPVRRYVERHLGGDVLHIQLSNQVSFLNKAALTKVLDSARPGEQVLVDAENTDYIDPDIVDLLCDFSQRTGPARGVAVSMKGFRDWHQIDDQIQYVDHSTRELQTAMTPAQVLQILKDGNKRFRKGHQLTRDMSRLINATAVGQHPLAVIVGCIDSRVPAELIFDAGVGDIFVVRVAGNIAPDKVLGSVEYACAIAGAKLVVVMGHTRCGAVTAAVNALAAGDPNGRPAGCEHVTGILREIQESIDPELIQAFPQLSPAEQERIVNQVALQNTAYSIKSLQSKSQSLARLVGEGRIAIVGAMYDVATGGIEFFSEDDVPAPTIEPAALARV